MNIIDHLYEIYLKEEWWDTPKVERHVIDAYHRVLLSRGNIFYEDEGDKLIGYAEILKINFEQFGKVICKAYFDHMVEDTLQGNIALVQSVWIDKEHRNTNVIKNMKVKFLEFTKDCDYFTGIALRKKTQPVKVFHRSKLEDFIVNKENIWALGQF